MNSSTVNLDDSFGPVYAQYFDFTRLFEDTILSILPCVCFLCILPWRISWLLQEPRKVSGSALHAGKVVCFPGSTRDHMTEIEEREIELKIELIYLNR